MRTSHSHIATPIIGRVTQLNLLVLKYTKQTSNEIKHPYVDKIKTAGLTLYINAIKMLDCKSSATKAHDALVEFRSLSYLIYALGGLTQKHLVVLDEECCAIEEQLNSIQYGQNVKSNG